MEGFDVRSVTTANDGLKQAAAQHPDAILLDLRMPVMDGLDFLRALRAQEGARHAPVAIVTGDYFIDDRMMDEIRALGAVVKFKPLWLEDLVAITRELLISGRTADAAENVPEALPA